MSVSLVTQLLLCYDDRDQFTACRNASPIYSNNYMRLNRALVMKMRCQCSLAPIAINVNVVCRLGERESMLNVDCNRFIVMRYSEFTANLDQYSTFFQLLSLHPAVLSFYSIRDFIFVFSLLFILFIVIDSLLSFFFK